MIRDHRTALVTEEKDGQSIVRKCDLVGISRSSFCCDPRGESELYLKPMKLIGARFIETQWCGSREMARWLRRQGHGVGRPWAGV